MLGEAVRDHGLHIPATAASISLQEEHVGSCCGLLLLLLLLSISPSESDRLPLPCRQ
jgi:hypothetical protein